MRERPDENSAYEDGYIFGEETEGARFKRCTFRKVVLKNLKTCMFENCEFKYCNSEDGIENVHLKDCSLFRPEFASITLKNIDIRNTEFIEATFNSSSFHEVSLRSVRGLDTSWRLYDVHVEPGPAHAWQIELDGQIEGLQLSRLNRIASWTRLRTFGELPFFGGSYVGLVSIPTVMLLISVFNDQVERFNEWGEHVGGPAFAVAHLHPIPVPPLNLLLLLSLLLLAIASTVYAVVCPSRIKEFSYARWIDEFRRPGLQYLPLGWENPWARLSCAICYPLGAAGSAFVLLWKVATAALYIFRHSPMPWMLR